MTIIQNDPDRLTFPPFILIGIWLAVSYWVVESYFDTVLIENVSFAMRLFPSDLNELWMRGLICALLIGFGLYTQRIRARLRSAETMNLDAAWLLKNALSNTIRGNFHICVFCKNIRDQEGEWVAPDRFISARTEASISKGLCTECQVQQPLNKARGEGPKN